MTVNKRAKVVSLSSKHAPHELSILDFHALRSQLLELLPVSDELYRSTDKKFHAVSSSSRRMAECARSFGHNYIGTEHLAMSLLAETSGDAALLIERLGVDPNSLRDVLAERTRNL